MMTACSLMHVIADEISEKEVNFKYIGMRQWEKERQSKTGVYADKSSCGTGYKLICAMG